jgi:hypothetical protein
MVAMARATIFVGCWLGAAHCDEPSFVSIRGFVRSVLRTEMPRRQWQPSRMWHDESLVT